MVLLLPLFLFIHNTLTGTSKNHRQTSCTVRQEDNGRKFKEFKMQVSRYLFSCLLPSPTFTDTDISPLTVICLHSLAWLNGGRYIQTELEVLAIWILSHSYLTLHFISVHIQCPFQNLKCRHERGLRTCPYIFGRGQMVQIFDVNLILKLCIFLDYSH